MVLRSHWKILLPMFLWSLGNVVFFSNSPFDLTTGHPVLQCFFVGLYELCCVLCGDLKKSFLTLDLGGIMMGGQQDA